MDHLSFEYLRSLRYEISDIRSIPSGHHYAVRSNWIYVIKRLDINDLSFQICINTQSQSGFHHHPKYKKQNLGSEVQT